MTRYQKRISGPLLDRIDIHLDVPRVDCEQLTDQRAGEASGGACEGRGGSPGAGGAVRRHGVFHTNADMGPGEVQQFVRLGTAGEQLMAAAVRQLALSARAYHRVLKLSRTIADLAGADGVEAARMAEALQYRPRHAEI
ncbi:MAG TPA: ATP-binding protein [Thermomicrobiales bacterium]|nr:ATP-binding protein [Thermomicrobiales bacterium]